MRERISTEQAIGRTIEGIVVDRADAAAFIMLSGNAYLPLDIYRDWADDSPEIAIGDDCDTRPEDELSLLDLRNYGFIEPAEYAAMLEKKIREEAEREESRRREKEESDRLTEESDRLTYERLKAKYER